MDQRISECIHYYFVSDLGKKIIVDDHILSTIAYKTKTEKQTVTYS